MKGNVVLQVTSELSMETVIIAAQKRVAKLLPVNAATVRGCSSETL